MRQQGDAQQGIKWISEMWLNYFEKLYKERWRKVTQLLTKMSRSHYLQHSF